MNVTRQSRPVYRDELRELIDQVKRIADALENNRALEGLEAQARVHEAKINDMWKALDMRPVQP